jgi:lysozyme
MAVKKTSKEGIDFIKEHEAWRSKAYKDQAGLWTIGYGHLINMVSEGNLVTTEITKEKGLELLAKDLKGAENAVLSLVVKNLKQNEFDALVSLVFNIGRGAFSGSTVLKKINTGASKEDISNWWRAWNKVTINGQKVASNGLTKRRQSEVDFFFMAA